MPGKETDIVARTLEILEKAGYWAWRANSGRVLKGGYSISLSPAGTPDILIVLRSGRLCGAEAKRNLRTEEQRESQAKWQAKAKRHRVGYLLFDEPKQVLEACKQWEKERTAP